MYSLYIAMTAQDSSSIILFLIAKRVLRSSRIFLQKWSLMLKLVPLIFLPRLFTIFFSLKYSYFASVGLGIWLSGLFPPRPQTWWKLMFLTASVGTFSWFCKRFLHLFMCLLLPVLECHRWQAVSHAVSLKTNDCFSNFYIPPRAMLIYRWGILLIL